MTRHRAPQPERPYACVLGGTDLLRPLGLAGIRSWVMSRPGRPPGFSRFVDGVIEPADPWREPEAFVDRLLSFAREQRSPPVVIYENDGHAAVLSRYREELLPFCTYAIPDKALVEDLIDKGRFLERAAGLGLPVPPSQVIPAGSVRLDLDLPYPMIVKPLTRDDRDRGWTEVGGTAKAVVLQDERQTTTILRRLEGAGIAVLAQAMISGPESAIESYHAYAAAPGHVEAEFTGRKVRTLPPEFGHSTALTTSLAPDVRRLGRRIIQLLQLAGVAKLDFKRDSEGRLHLLEVNPRFTLWNHLGAVAGVNLPAIVYADLTGGARPHETDEGRVVTWCDVPQDFSAARAAGLPLWNWGRWAATADIKVDFAWDDPMPFVRGRVLGRLRRTVRQRLPI